MRKTRKPLEAEIDDGTQPIILKFPTELRNMRNTTKMYDGIPTLSITVYRNMKEREYRRQIGQAS